MDLHLQGKRALVTGSTAGIGLAIAQALANEGAQVFARGLSAEQVEREFFRDMRPTSLLRRFETPEEVAVIVAYLASPVASGTTGAAVRVDGGVVRSIA